jgi:F-type H+-transporting ATPase subunit gamma
MANLKELRNRIGSVRNTRKITQAMSRIASARLRKAQTVMLEARPYGARMAEVVGDLVAELDAPTSTHPLLAQRAVRRTAIVLVTADRGLCGGFNSNASREAARFIDQRRAAAQAPHIVCVGRKGATYLSYRRHTVAEQRPAPDVDSALAGAASLARDLRGLFTEADPERRVDEVWVVYNHFKNVLTQEIRTQQILPVPGSPAPTEAGPRRARRQFEPRAEELLDDLLPVAVESAIQQIFFDSVAAEIAARRQAMDSATDNATQLVADLTLEYNRERQAAITKELMEIIGGAEALKA